MAALTGDTASDAAPAVNVVPSEAKTGIENFAPIAAKPKARTNVPVSPASSPNGPAIVADAAVKIDTIALDTAVAHHDKLNECT